MYLFITLLIFLLTMSVVQPTIGVLDRGILPIEENSVALQFFVDIENESYESDCKVYSHCIKCCVAKLTGEDCDGIEAYGLNYDIVQPRDRISLLFVYPTIRAYNRMGHCDFGIDYNCVRKRRQRKRQVVVIPFDTRLYKSHFATNRNLMEVYKRKNPKYCRSIDQDPLNDCMPVNCDWYYHGNRPFYDKKRNICTEAPFCVSIAPDDDADEDGMPVTVYVPSANVCRNLKEPIAYEDVYAFKNGATISVTTPAYFKLQRKKLNPKSKLFGRLWISQSDNYATSCTKLIIQTLACAICVFAVILASCYFMRSCVSIASSSDSNHKLKKYFTRLKTSLKKKCQMRRESARVKDELLKEVICRDLPEKCRDNIRLCERMNRTVKWKRRYRMADLGSQVSLDTSVGDSEDGRDVSDTGGSEDDANETSKLLTSK